MRFTLISHLISICILFFISFFICASDEQYKKEYKTGMVFYKKNDFKQAEFHLRKSFNLHSHSATAYFIAHSNYKLRQFVAAVTFANMAKDRLTPELDSEKKADLEKIVAKISESAKEDYRRSIVTSKYTLTHNTQGGTVKDLAKVAGINQQRLRDIQKAKAFLLSLGIEPKDVYDSDIPDKCESGYRGHLDSEDFINCLEVYSK
jgi:hypothetical protein